VFKQKYTTIIIINNNNKNFGADEMELEFGNGLSAAVASFS